MIICYQTKYIFNKITLNKVAFKLSQHLITKSFLREIEKIHALKYNSINWKMEKCT